MKSAYAGLAALGVALTVISGCVTPVSHPPPAAEAPEPVSIQGFSRNPFQRITLPASRMHRHEQAVAALGQPRQTIVKDMPDQHDKTRVNSLITLRYSFAELVYLHVSGKDVENLILLSIRANDQPLKYGIRIGATTREEILKLFGMPEESRADAFAYDVQYTQEMTNSTTFFFDGDALSRIDISSLMMD